MLGVDVSGWIERASALAPLLSRASSGAWGGESGVLRAIFDAVPAGDGFAIEFGQRRVGAGTVAELAQERGWGVLYMDREAHEAGAGETPPGITLARHTVTAANINELFQRYGVPARPDVLVIDIDGMDYWVWRALSERCAPSLVVIEFNAHVPFGIAAALEPDDGWTYQPGKDYGASYTAMCALARDKGYRLVHVHGPWNLYFLREDLGLPDGWAVKQPLTADELALLTDTEGFYDALCGPGRRPTWQGKPAPDVARAPWRLLAPEAPSKLIDVAGVALKVLADKHDLQWYQQRKVHEERRSLLYRFLREDDYAWFVDIGASVGYVSLVAALESPALRGVAVEADPRLARLLRDNLRRNLGDDQARVEVINAVAGEHERGGVSFGLNPKSTLDNRVCMPQWEQIEVPMRRLDGILSRLGVKGRTFFKIDTQGYELRVLRGLEPWLAASREWALKMEFAPDWLRSQGTDPEAVLDHLLLRYEVAEFPERIPYGTPGLDALFRCALRPADERDFIAHVVALAAKGLGWVDLVVRPRR
jgi:FkbM family methyltransferase